MLGVEGVTRALFTHASAALPGRVAELRARYGASVGVLPDFAKIYPDEINTLSIEKFPALAITIPATTGKIDNRQTDIDATFEEYSYRYTVQLFAYAVADNSAATSKAIKRYTLAVREAFLANKILPVDDTGDTAQVDPQTLVESYSELDKKDSKFIAASFVQFEIVTTERLYFPARFGTDPAVIELGAALEEHPHFNE